MKEKSPQSILLSSILILTLVCGYGILQLKGNLAQNNIYSLTAEINASDMILVAENQAVNQYNSKAYTRSPLAILSANLPSFRVKAQMVENANSSNGTDFPVINAELVAAKVSLNKNTANEPTKANNNYAYKYIQKEQHTAKSYTYQPNSQNTDKLSAIRQTSSSSNQTYAGVAFPSSVQPISNNSTNSFLVNNTLSITTDLSVNNSAMLVDGLSDPGNPGIPVGDGIWILLGMLGMYGLRKILKESVYSTDL